MNPVQKTLEEASRALDRLEMEEEQQTDGAVARVVSTRIGHFHAIENDGVEFHASSHPPDLREAQEVCFIAWLWGIIRQKMEGVTATLRDTASDWAQRDLWLEGKTFIYQTISLAVSYGLMPGQRPSPLEPLQPDPLRSDTIQKERIKRCFELIFERFVICFHGKDLNQPLEKDLMLRYLEAIFETELPLIGEEVVRLVESLSRGECDPETAMQDLLTALGRQIQGITRECQEEKRMPPRNLSMICSFIVEAFNRKESFFNIDLSDFPGNGSACISIKHRHYERLVLQHQMEVAIVAHIAACRQHFLSFGHGVNGFDRAFLLEIQNVSKQTGMEREINRFFARKMLSPAQIQPHREEWAWKTRLAQEGAQVQFRDMLAKIRQELQKLDEQLAAWRAGLAGILRQERNINIMEAARAFEERFPSSGMGWKQIQEVENGQRPITAEEARQFAEVYGVKPSLLGLNTT